MSTHDLSGEGVAARLEPVARRALAGAVKLRPLKGRRLQEALRDRNALFREELRSFSEGLRQLFSRRHVLPIWGWSWGAWLGAFAYSPVWSTLFFAIGAGAIVQAGARVGEDTLINTGASVDHDCVVGPHVHVGPGVTLSEDEAVGFAFLSKESLQLGSDNELLNVEKGSSRAFPDRRQSWFEEIRIDDGADCDEVLAAEADGRFTRLGPFRR